MIIKTLRQVTAGLLSLSALTLVSGCAPEEQVGIPISGRADGIITVEESAAIIDMIATDYQVRSLDDKTKDYNVRNLVNDIASGFQGDGVLMAGFDSGVAIDFSETKTILTEKYRELTGYLPPSETAFYYEETNAMYFPVLNLLSFLSTFHHEKGHEQAHMHANIDQDGIHSEIYSEVNRMFFKLKMYNLDRDLGALTMDSLFLPREDITIVQTEETGSYEGDYSIGELVALHRITRAGGNMEYAINDVFSQDADTLEQVMLEHIGGAQVNLNEAYTLLLDNVVESPNLRDSFSNLSEQEFDELRDYMRIRVRALKKNLEDDFDEENYRLSLEGYLNTPGNTNPYFRNKIINMLTDQLSEIIYSLVEEIPADIGKLWGFATHSIDINRDTPCEYHPIECPNDMVEPRKGHIDAYFYALITAEAYLDFYGDKDIALQGLEYAQEFFDKFYPDSIVPDAAYENRDYVAGSVALNAAAIEEHLAQQSRDENNLYGEVTHSCNAAYWYDIQARFDEDAVNLKEKSEALKKEYSCSK